MRKHIYILQDLEMNWWQLEIIRIEGSSRIKGILEENIFPNFTVIDSYILSCAINIWYENVWLTEMA